MNKNTLKSIGAVLAGILTVVALSIFTDIILESIGLFPPATEGLFDTSLLFIALTYRTIYAFLGGFVTGKIGKSLKLVKILLVFGTIMGIVGVFVGWNLSQQWYPISLVITSALAVWYGGQVAIKSKP